MFIIRIKIRHAIIRALSIIIERVCPFVKLRLLMQLLLLLCCYQARTQSFCEVQDLHLMLSRLPFSRKDASGALQQDGCKIQTGSQVLRSNRSSDTSMLSALAIASSTRLLRTRFSASPCICPAKSSFVLAGELK